MTKCVQRVPKTRADSNSEGWRAEMPHDDVNVTKTNTVIFVCPTGQDFVNPQDTTNRHVSTYELLIHLKRLVSTHGIPICVEKRAEMDGWMFGWMDDDWRATCSLTHFVFFHQNGPHRIPGGRTPSPH
jgi:hypothetical protein